MSSLAAVAAEAGGFAADHPLAFGGARGCSSRWRARPTRPGTHVAIMRDIRRGDGRDAATLLAFDEAWLRNLSEIYPVGILLVAASITDADAAEVLRARMVDSLLGAFTTILRRLDAVGNLAPGRSP